MTAKDGGPWTGPTQEAWLERFDPTKGDFTLEHAADGSQIVTPLRRTKSLEIVVPGHPPGGNDLHRMHPFVVRKHREIWKASTAERTRRARASLDEIDPSAPWTRVSVGAVWRYRIKRTRDLDNLVAGLKPMIDGLVEAGLLEDDHSGILVALGPFTVEIGSPTDETVLVVTAEEIG
jgi:hypothetical protein